jgi:LacI family transcriptional regulator
MDQRVNAPSGKRATIFDVAARAGVSIKTVSRVINNAPSVRGATRERVMRAVADLDFAADARARGLAGGRSGTIGMVAPGLASVYSLYLFDIVRGVVERAAAAGCRAVILPDMPAAAGCEADQDDYVRFLRERHADGLVVLLRPENRARTARLLRAGLPAVAIDDGLLASDLPSVAADNRQAGDVEPDALARCLADLPSITADNRRAARAAVEHLIRLGHRRIAHIAGMPVFGCAHEREAGYREAMAAAGLAAEAIVVGGDHLRRTGFRVTQALLASPRPPTAVFCACDDTALGAMDAARSLGLTVGRDLACVGFNDTRAAAEASPPLTTVHQPLSEFGRRATDRLLDWLETGGPSSPRREVLTCHLVVRHSCGALPPGPI